MTTCWGLPHLLTERNTPGPSASQPLRQNQPCNPLRFSNHRPFFTCTALHANCATCFRPKPWDVAILTYSLLKSVSKTPESSVLRLNGYLLSERHVRRIEENPSKCRGESRQVNVRYHSEQALKECSGRSFITSRHTNLRLGDSSAQRATQRRKSMTGKDTRTTSCVDSVALFLRHSLCADPCRHRGMLPVTVQL